MHNSEKVSEQSKLLYHKVSKKPSISLPWMSLGWPGKLDHLSKKREEANSGKKLMPTLSKKSKSELHSLRSISPRSGKNCK